MTTETSNARGELRMADIREDAREPLQLLREKLVRDEDGWAALCQLMPMLAAPPPADAEPKTLPVPTRVHLIGETAVIVGTPERGWDENAQDAHNCDAMGCATIGPHVLARVPFTDERALAAAQQKDGGGCSHEAWEENGGWCECVDCGHGWSARTAPPSAPKAQPLPNGVIQRHVVTKFSDGSTRVEDVLTTPSAPVGVEDVVMAARNAENAIRNCAAAGQIGEGYVQYADDLRDAVQRLAQQPAAARVDVRGLVALAEQWERDAAECRRDGYIDAAVVKEDCAQRIRQTLGISAIAEALAAEGVQAEPKAEAQLTYKGVPIGPMQTFADIERQASAPVGVDAAKHWHDLYRKECQLRQDDAARYGQQIADLEALAQQPAAVDGARFRKAPCYLCGYNGPGYFQPETHPCAALYHADQPGGSDHDRRA